MATDTAKILNHCGGSQSPSGLRTNHLQVDETGEVCPKAPRFRPVPALGFDDPGELDCWGSEVRLIPIIQIKTGGRRDD